MDTLYKEIQHIEVLWIISFNKDDIELHSIRTGGVMVMLSSEISVIIIIRVGSEAFLEYIKEQVESFIFCVSQGMLQFEEFFNLSRENL